MASRGRRVVPSTDRPENETGAGSDAPQLSGSQPLAPPREGFAARPGDSERGAPSSVAPDEPAAPPRSVDVSDAARALSHDRPNRGWEALSEELASYACRSIDIAARTAIDMLGVKTWSDAVAVNTALACSGIEEWLDSSAKISAAGLDLAAESVKPFLGGLPGIRNAVVNAGRPL